jgi:protein-S-isoprenylcysteine O-methyltransferase Ste14
MITNHILLAVAWSSYCILHSVFASLWFKEKVRTLLKEDYRHYRLLYTLFAFIGFLTILFFQVSIASPPIYKITTTSKIIGGLIGLTGLLVMLFCIKKYFMQLSGLKALIQNRINNELMITGIHKKVRHPLYAGTFIFIWGLLIFFPYPSLLIANLIITIYTLIGIRFEENKLEKEFGEAYRAYKKEVPMIIPNLSHR